MKRKWRSLIPLSCALVLGCLGVGTSTFAWFKAVIDAEIVDSSAEFVVNASQTSALQLTDGEKPWSQELNLKDSSDHNLKLSLSPVAHDTVTPFTTFGEPSNWYYQVAASSSSWEPASSDKTYLTESNFGSYVYKLPIYFKSSSLVEGVTVESVTLPENEEGSLKYKGVSLLFVGPDGYSEFNESTPVDSGGEIIPETPHLLLSDIGDTDELQPANQKIEVYLYVDGTNEFVNSDNISNIAGQISFAFTTCSYDTVYLQTKKNGFGNQTTSPTVVFGDSSHEIDSYESQMSLVSDYFYDDVANDDVRVYSCKVASGIYDQVDFKAYDNTTKTVTYTTTTRTSASGQHTNEISDKILWLSTDQVDTNKYSIGTDLFAFIAFKNNGKVISILYNDFSTPEPSRYPNDPVSETHYFKGWSTDGDPEHTIIDPAEFILSTGTILNAEWSTDPVKYSVYLQGRSDDFSFGGDQPSIKLTKSSDSSKELIQKMKKCVQKPDGTEFSHHYYDAKTVLSDGMYMFVFTFDIADGYDRIQFIKGADSATTETITFDPSSNNGKVVCLNQYNNGYTFNSWASFPKTAIKYYDKLDNQIGNTVYSSEGVLVPTESKASDQVDGGKWFTGWNLNGGSTPFDFNTGLTSGDLMEFRPNFLSKQYFATIHRQAGGQAENVPLTIKANPLQGYYELYTETPLELASGDRFKISDNNPTGKQYFGDQQHIRHNMSFDPNTSNGYLNENNDYVAHESGSYNVYARFTDSTYDTYDNTYVSFEDATKIYLDTASSSLWDKDSSWFAVYFFSSTSPANGNFGLAEEGDHVYSVTLDDYMLQDYDRLIFLKMRNGTQFDWSNVQSRTINLKKPSDSNTYTISDVNGSGSWTGHTHSFTDQHYCASCGLPTTESSYDVFYLDANDNSWNKDGAWFYAYFWNSTNNNSESIVMRPYSGSTYTAIAPKSQGYDRVIFCRMSHSASQPSWNPGELLAQTPDLWILSSGRTFRIANNSNNGSWVDHVHSYISHVCECGNVESGYKYFYLNAGGSGLWDQGGAKFGIWNIDNSSWTDFLVKQSDGKYRTNIPISASIKKLIFVRFKDTTTTPAWVTENVWNQTNDLTVPADKSTYTITGWGGGDGSWS